MAPLKVTTIFFYECSCREDERCVVQNPGIHFDPQLLYVYSCLQVAFYYSICGLQQQPFFTICDVFLGGLRRIKCWPDPLSIMKAFTPAFNGFDGGAIIAASAIAGGAQIPLEQINVRVWAERAQVAGMICNIFLHSSNLGPSISLVSRAPVCLDVSILRRVACGQSLSNTSPRYDRCTLFVR